MGWLSPKCPRCGGVLQETGYCAPYPTHRRPSCIAAHQSRDEIKALQERVQQLEQQSIKPIDLVDEAQSKSRTE